MLPRGISNPRLLVLREQVYPVRLRIAWTATLRIAVLGPCDDLSSLAAPVQFRGRAASFQFLLATLFRQLGQTLVVWKRRRDGSYLPRTRLRGRRIF